MCNQDEVPQEVDIQHARQYPMVYAAKSESSQVLENSSSGGLFFELAKPVIAGGGIVYGCAYDEKFHAHHIRCDTIEKCSECMGSKYVQSEMGDIFLEVQRDLREGREVLFTGTPCQAAAVRSFIGNDSRLITVDIICHGVPSPGVFEAWLKALETIKGKKIVRYEHRPKNKGWKHLERITWEDGSTDQDSNLGVAWKYLFYGDEILRPSCYQCRFANTVRSSDITIGDFWKIEQTKVADMAGKMGVSAVLVNSKVGESLFARAQVIAKPASIQEVILGNPMLVHPTSRKLDRDAVWEQLYRNGLVSMMKDRHYLVSPLRHRIGSMKRKLTAS